MARRSMDIYAQNAVRLLFEVSNFLVNPGRLGKSELGELINQILRYSDGLLLPKDNTMVRRLVALKRMMAPDGCLNKTVLEELAACFGGKFWDLPGLKTTFTLESSEPKLRNDLGLDFEKWAGRRVIRCTEGLYVDTAIRTDPHRSIEWAEHFGLNAILGKKSKPF